MVNVKISKNARRSGSDVFLCKGCGKEIKMVTIAKNGSLRHEARCTGCGEVRRRPSDFGYRKE